jgi:hypothetical protein
VRDRRSPMTSFRQGLANALTSTLDDNSPPRLHCTTNTPKRSDRLLMVTCPVLIGEIGRRSPLASTLSRGDTRGTATLLDQFPELR